MRYKYPLLLALGASFGLVTLLDQRRRSRNAQVWTQVAQDRPGTAVITGASAGIGETFARALAHQGYHLLLMARREERLREVAAEIQTAYPVQVDILSVDLSDPADLERAAIHISEISDLSLLVNNAGFGTGGNFAEIDMQPELRMIRLHVIASVRLTRAALPGMIARGRGGIINVSSLAALLPMPGNASYGSTKAYLNFFTGSLNQELAGTGVRVQALCPGFTYSEFHDVMGVSRSTIPAFMWMPADQVVAESLQGLREGREIVIPGALNRLMAWFLRFPLTVPLARFAQRLRLVQQWKGV
jgi:short-subunit dehydrogenase